MAFKTSRISKLPGARRQDNDTPMSDRAELTGLPEGRRERESFENIYFDLSKKSGSCRFATTGLGWKPSAGGDPTTVDKNDIGGAQWSRAARGYEVKIQLRNGRIGIIQLDGFQLEVMHSLILISL